MSGEAGPEANDLKFGLGSPLYGADPEKYDEALRGTKAGSEFELEVESFVLLRVFANGHVGQLVRDSLAEFIEQDL